MQKHNEELKDRMEKLKDVVRAATTSEEKKTALLEEVKLAVQKEREGLRAKEKEVDKDKGQLEEYRRIKEEELLALRRELDDGQFRLKEAKMKHEDLSQRYANLEQEQRALQSKNDTQAKQIHALQQSSDKDKVDAAAYEEQLKRECEDARAEIEDLSDLVKTKDRMLEDQVITITDFKEKIKEKEEEIK